MCITGCSSKVNSYRDVPTTNVFGFYEIVTVLGKQIKVETVVLVLRRIQKVIIVTWMVKILIVKTITVSPSLEVEHTVMKYAVTRILRLFCVGFSEYFCFFYKMDV